MEISDKKGTNYPVTSLIYYLTETCNLECSYCFVKKSNQSTNLTIGKKVVDFLVNNSGACQNLHLRFFGGEPLLKLQLLKQIAAYARKQSKLHNKYISLEVISNCLLLNDEVISILQSLDIKLLISLDGRSGTLRQNRGISLTPEAHETFISNIKKAVHTGICKEYCATISINNHQNFIEDIKYIKELGKNTPIRITLETSPDWKEEQIIEIYQKLTDFYLENATKGYIPPLALTNFLLLLKHQENSHRYNVIKEPSCLAGKNRFGINTKGELFFCHRLIDFGHTHKAGDVFSGIDEEKRHNWISSLENHKSGVCRNCTVSKYCQKSCTAVNQMNNGNAFSLSDITCFEFKQHMIMVNNIYNTLSEKNNTLFINYLDKTLHNQQNKKDVCLMDHLKLLEIELMAK